MVWEDWQGNERRVSFGELQELSNRFANVLEARRGRARRPRGHAAAVAARDGGGLPRHLQARRDPALDVGALRRRGHRAPPARLGRAARGHRRGEPRPHPRGPGRAGARDGRRLRAGDGRRLARLRDRRTRRPTIPPSSTTRRARPGLAKGILHAHRYLLAHEEFEFCHDVRDGELFHGSGEWAWAAGICPLLGPVALRRGRARAGAQGRLRPRGAPALPLEARRGEHVHHAHRAARDDRRGGRGQALPARASCASPARPASRSTPR